MKIIVLVVSSIATLSRKTQNIYPIGTYDINDTSYYLKDTQNHHDNIVGIRKWINGNTSFEFTLQEFEMNPDHLDDSRFVDNIFGKYTYIENGQVVSDIPEIKIVPQAKLTFIFINPTEYKVYIRDLISQTSKVGTFILTSATTADLVLRNSSGIKMNYGNDQEWSLPTNITMIKQ